MNPSFYNSRASFKKSRRRPQKSARGTVRQGSRDQEEGGILQQPGAFRMQGNHPSDNSDIVSVEDSTVVPPPSVAQDSVIRVPEAHLVDPTETEEAIARAVQEATQQTQEENERAIERAERAERELRAIQEAQQPIVQSERVQRKKEPPTVEQEEERNSFRIPAFIRKHAVISCALCSLLLLSAVGAGLGVAFSSSTSSGEGGNSGSNSRSVPSSSPTKVESTPPAPSPLPLDEPTARTPTPTLGRVASTLSPITENPTLEPTPQPTKKPTPHPTKKPTLRPTPQLTPIPTQRPTAAPVVMTTAPTIPSSTVVGISSWIQVGSTLTGNATGGLFGNALALSSDGTIVAVGAKGAYDDVAFDAGHVQVFQRNGGVTDEPQAEPQAAGQWQPMGAALKGDAANNDYFGSSVALSSNGQILAVGADEEYSNGRPGYVCVFEYDSFNQKWNPQGSKIVGVAAGDWFGWSVTLSFDGNTLAVGASRNDDNGYDAGHVRVFAFNSNSNEWVQKGSTLTGVAEYDRFGYSLDLSADGTVLAVGTENNDDIRAFQFNSISNDWDALGEFIHEVAAYAYFGSSVALSSNGMVLATGAYWNNDNGSESGHVRVFDYNTSANQWIQRGSVIVGVAADDQFGESVALSADGNQVAAGAIYNDDIAESSGHVRVFRYKESSRGTTTGQWKQVGAALTGVGGEQDLFGSSVAMSADGTVVAGGASEFNSYPLGPGYVCVYEGVVD